MLYLTEADIRQTIDIADAFTFVEKGIWACANNRVIGSSFRLPVTGSRYMYTSGGYLIGESWAFIQSAAFGWLPVTTNMATPPLVTLIDVVTGKPVCLFEADWALALKNSVANVVAAAGLARSDATMAAVIGAGRSAQAHIYALAERFNLKQVWLLAGTQAQAEEDAANLQEHQNVVVTPLTLDHIPTVLPRADIVLSLGQAQTPLVTRRHLKPGALLLRTGSGPTLAADVLMGADKVIVDSWENAAQQIEELRDLVTAGEWRQENLHGEWPDVVANKIAGRESITEVIVYLTTGVQAESAALFPEIFRRAQRLNLGREIDS